MNLHDVLMELANTHEKMNKKGYSDLISFDFYNRKVYCRDVVLVENGEIIPQTINLEDKELVLDNDFGELKGEFYSGLEKRYEAFYTSVPSKHDEYGRYNFIAKKPEDMTFEEMLYGEKRSVAKYELEWWVMANVIKGRVRWNKKHWYWQSKKNPKLVLFKKDVEGVCY